MSVPMKLREDSEERTARGSRDASGKDSTEKVREDKAIMSVRRSSHEGLRLESMTR